MKHFLLSWILLLMAYLVHSNADAGSDVGEPTASSQLDYHSDLRTNHLDVLVQQDQDAHRKRDLEIIQAFVEIHATMKTLEQRIDGLILENQSWKAQFQVLATSKTRDAAETAIFRSRVEDEIQNLKAQIQNITNSKAAEVVIEVGPSPANATDDTNQLQTFNTTMEPETESTGPDQKWLDDMLKNPLAELYGGENFTGKAEWYHFESSNKGQCHMIGSLSGRVKSVKTFGKCIRLFRGDDCSGWSFAVYPGSTVTHSVLNSKLLKVESVGPCLEDEFHGSTFQDVAKETVRKVPNEKDYVPDLVEFYSFKKYNNGTSLSSSNNPITRYTLGPKNRVEFLRADIYPRHLNISQPNVNMRNSSLFTSLEPEEGDVVGYGIPPSVGGPWDAHYNIFPQTLAGSLEWEEIISGARQCLEADGGTYEVVGVNFIYADSSQTRPKALYYYKLCSKGTFYDVTYGRVVN